ncbi:AccI family restriction endonuclease [Barnesiella sp. An55]|uniref:AccI family restriction endonuclease n=1 Tax=Barnesiella sp. An55 TaxID=1965646 RepID=UPI000B39A67F|nr:AccI family restriction endonuclease [Barnesiella sp. An55]OUN72107.1 restriction endonuclease [Barnesiella sp. An55]HIZ25547.1 AccI family restriction endonuclease [Candidatus Barnesiella merdipullorum]
MTYFERIKELTSGIPVELVDFSQERTRASAPTQASSNFITNKEQGDWAENLVMRAINSTSQNYVAVHYGKNDDLVAGDEGFDAFYEEFQNELDTIGKRPDLLIFRKSDFRTDLGFDISRIPHEEIDEYVRMAVAGIEVRSSAFLIDKYEEAMTRKTEQNISRAIELKEEILNSYSGLLNHPLREKYRVILNSINRDTIHACDFKVPGWRSSAALIELNERFKELKSCIKEIQKRDYLSITPKVEDIKVVYKWIETFNVPHYYFQVFFDKVYGISFEQILHIISDSDNEGDIFSIEQDTKNQNKTTIKIKSKVGYEIAYKVDEPSHNSVRKEMNRGRLLFYVSFQGGTAYLDLENLKAILHIESEEF